MTYSAFDGTLNLTQSKSNMADSGSKRKSSIIGARSHFRRCRFRTEQKL